MPRGWPRSAGWARTAPLPSAYTPTTDVSRNLAAAQPRATGDDALDLLDQLLGGILARADRAGTRERLRTLPALTLAAAQLRDAVKVLLDPRAGDLAAIWAAMGARCPAEHAAFSVPRQSQSAVFDNANALRIGRV